MFLKKIVLVPHSCLQLNLLSIYELKVCIKNLTYATQIILLALLDFIHDLYNDKNGEKESESV